MNKLRERLRYVMAGRYGVDSFSKFLVILALILALANFYFRSFLGVLSFILLVFVYVRAFSRDFARRTSENARFMTWFSPIIRAYRDVLTRLKDRNHRYLRCPNCKKGLRVPRGKGKIRITCPQCRESFEKKI